MKTVITLEVEHSKPIQHLAAMIAGRAYTIDGVKDARQVSYAPTEELLMQGFKAEEIMLGIFDVERG